MSQPYGGLAPRPDSSLSTPASTCNQPVFRQSHQCYSQHSSLQPDTLLRSTLPTAALSCYTSHTPAHPRYHFYTDHRRFGNPACFSVPILFYSIARLRIASVSASHAQTVDDSRLKRRRLRIVARWRSCGPSLVALDCRAQPPLSSSCLSLRPRDEAKRNRSACPLSHQYSTPLLHWPRQYRQAVFPNPYSADRLIRRRYQPSSTRHHVPKCQYG